MITWTHCRTGLLRTIHYPAASSAHDHDVMTSAAPSHEPMVWRWWLVGGAGRSLSILWFYEAVYAGDTVHSTRLAPAASLWMAKLLWGVASRANDTAERGPSTAVAILEQLTPVCCMGLCTLLTWWEYGTPEELTVESLGLPLLEGGTISHEQRVSAAAAELVASAVFGVFLGLLAVVAPVIFHSVGLLQSAWPPDPVPGLEAQHLADLAEKVRNTCSSHSLAAHATYHCARASSQESRRQLENRVDRASSVAAIAFSLARIARLGCLAISEELLCAAEPSRMHNNTSCWLNVRAWWLQISIGAVCVAWVSLVRCSSVGAGTGIGTGIGLGLPFW